RQKPPRACRPVLHRNPGLSGCCSCLWHWLRPTIALFMTTSRCALYKGLSGWKAAGGILRDTSSAITLLHKTSKVRATGFIGSVKPRPAAGFFMACLANQIAKPILPARLRPPYFLLNRSAHAHHFPSRVCRTRLCIELFFSERRFTSRRAGRPRGQAGLPSAGLMRRVLAGGCGAGLVRGRTTRYQTDHRQPLHDRYY